LLLDLRTRHEAETPSSHGLCRLACELRQAHSLASAGHSIYNTPNSFTRILRFVRQSNRQVSFGEGGQALCGKWESTELMKVAEERHFGKESAE
jgi:hypothetical protein